MFFDDDYAGEFKHIFQQRRLPLNGTVYVCAQDRTDDSAPPISPERLFFLVNAPADGDIKPFNPTEVDPCEQQCLKLLSQCGLSFDATTARHITNHAERFQPDVSGTGGALYRPGGAAAG